MSNWTFLYVLCKNKNQRFLIKLRLFYKTIENKKKQTKEFSWRRNSYKRMKIIKLIILYSLVKYDKYLIFTQISSKHYTFRKCKKDK